MYRQFLNYERNLKSHSDLAHSPAIKSPPGWRVRWMTMREVTSLANETIDDKCKSIWKWLYPLPLSPVQFRKWWHQMKRPSRARAKAPAQMPGCSSISSRMEIHEVRIFYIFSILMRFYLQWSPKSQVKMLLLCILFEFNMNDLMQIILLNWKSEICFVTFLISYRSTIMISESSKEFLCFIES